MREFTTAAKRTDAVPDGPPAGLITFKVDGTEFTARRPKDAAFAYLTAVTARGTTQADKIKGVLDFLELALVPESRERLRDRLLDPDDTYELDDATDLLMWLAEEWGGRPNGSGSG